MSNLHVAVALVHYPVLNRQGETSASSITTLDIHDFARTCAFYGVESVFLVHPSAGMQSLVNEINDYWMHGAGLKRNPGRGAVLKHVHAVASLDDILWRDSHQVWYTSAGKTSGTMDIREIMRREGNHLLVFGTGSGLDEENMASPNGWLSAIEGIGKVRHLSVRAALAIYLDRLFSV